MRRVMSRDADLITMLNRDDVTEEQFVAGRNDKCQSEHKSNVTAAPRVILSDAENARNAPSDSG